MDAQTVTMRLLAAARRARRKPGLGRWFVLTPFLAAGACACSLVALDPIAGVPLVPSPEAQHICTQVLGEVVEGRAVDDAAVVGAHDTTVAGVRVMESHAGEGDNLAAEPWPQHDAGDPAVLCYLDVGSIPHGAVKGPVTRFVVAYTSNERETGWFVLATGSQEEIAVPR